MWRWVGDKWVDSQGADAPLVFEVMDPQSLSANRRKRMSPGQFVTLLVEEEANLFVLPFRNLAAVAVGCLNWPAWIVFPLVWPLIWIVLSPFVLLMCLAEATFGLDVVEGRVTRTVTGRQWWISIGSDSYHVPAAIGTIMLDDREYRLYLTKLNPMVVNYERLTK
jgi:hypothetical protein